MRFRPLSVFKGRPRVDTRVCFLWWCPFVMVVFLLPPRSDALAGAARPLSGTEDFLEPNCCVPCGAHSCFSLDDPAVQGCLLAPAASARFQVSRASAPYPLAFQLSRCLAVSLSRCLAGQPNHADVSFALFPTSHSMHSMHSYPMSIVYIVRYCINPKYTEEMRVDGGGNRKRTVRRSSLQCTRFSSFFLFFFFLFSLFFFLPLPFFSLLHMAQHAAHYLTVRAYTIFSGKK